MGAITMIPVQLSFWQLHMSRGHLWVAPALHCTALHCTALRCTVLHCTAPHRTVLDFTALHHWTAPAGGAGEGLFTVRSVQPGELVAYFAGLLVEEGRGQASDYAINWQVAVVSAGSFYPVPAFVICQIEWILSVLSCLKVYPVSAFVLCQIVFSVSICPV